MQHLKQLLCFFEFFSCSKKKKYYNWWRIFYFFYKHCFLTIKCCYYLKKNSLYFILYLEDLTYSAKSVNFIIQNLRYSACISSFKENYLFLYFRRKTYPQSTSESVWCWMTKKTYTRSFISNIRRVLLRLALNHTDGNNNTISIIMRAAL